MWFAKHCADREGFADLRPAHVHFKFEANAVARDQTARLDAGASPNHEILLAAVGYEVSRNASGSVARDLGLTAVGIDETSMNVGILRWKEPLHAVRTH